MIIIDILTGSCLVSAFITCALGVYVLAKNPSSAVSRLFFAATLGGTYWAVGEFLLWTAESGEGTLFWLKFSSFWPVVIAVTAHFFYALSASVRKTRGDFRAIFAILYIPAFFLSFIGLFSNELYQVTYRAGTGWIYVPQETGVLYLIMIVYIVALMFWAAGLTIFSWYHAKDEKARGQLFLISIGITIVIASGMVSSIILPAYGMYVPNTVFVGIVFFSVFVTWAMVRYDLFVFTPETAARDIIRMMPDGLILADTGGIIISANPAAAGIFSAKDGDMTGKPVAEYLTVQAQTTVLSDLRKRGEISDHEILLPGDSLKVISLSGSVVRFPDGQKAGILLILRDITGRKRSETSLRLAHEKISKLTQITRHDISNLVTALSGYLEILHQSSGSREDGVYVGACTDIVGKITKQLEFSREYQEIGIHEPEWQDLPKVIRSALGDLPKNTLQFEAALDPVEVYADPMICKVLYNLFENAVRHGAHIRRMNVTTRRMTDGSLLLVIEDDGVGIKPENKERIFQYGYGSNTGLGLAISRDILSMTGISIAETGTYGKGARFEIRVPAGVWREVPSGKGNL